MTHHGPVALVEAELLAALLVGAAVVYVAAARGAAWPVGRTVRWLLGIGTAVAGVAVWSLGGAHDLRCTWWATSCWGWSPRCCW